VLVSGGFCLGDLLSGRVVRILPGGRINHWTETIGLGLGYALWLELGLGIGMGLGLQIGLVDASGISGGSRPGFLSVILCPNTKIINHRCRCHQLFKHLEGAYKRS